MIMAEEQKKTYKVKEGQVWGSNPELKEGETVELTEKEAAGFEDKLEPVEGTPPAPPEGAGSRAQGAPGAAPEPGTKPSVPRRTG
jgi:hypothetical protein